MFAKNLEIKILENISFVFPCLKLFFVAKFKLSALDGVWNSILKIESSI